MIYAGIDIGAGSMRLVTEEKGVVFDEPCLVAKDRKGNVLAIGSRAQELEGNEDIEIISPFQCVPADFDSLEDLLEEICYENRLFRSFQKTTLFISYPTSLSKEGIAVLEDHLTNLGAQEVYFDQEIWISALGAGLDLFLPVSSCVMNIGFSNCDMAVFRNGVMSSYTHQDRLNGQAVYKAIDQWLKEEKHLEVSRAVLEEIVRQLGNVKIKLHPKAMKAEGIDVRDGLSRACQIDENEIASLLAPLARAWGSWVQRFIAGLPEREALDVLDRGIVACGGCMRLDGLASLLSTMADCPVYIADNPANTVSHGLEILIQSIRSRKKKESSGRKSG